MKANQADDEEALRKAIVEYEAVIQVHPSNFEALESLGHLHLLLGDGYCTDRSEKRFHFRMSLRCNELAMYTNEGFRSLIDHGEPVWRATEALSDREMKPMFFWVTAVFYYYKECLGGSGQMLNFRWIRRARTVLEGLSKRDPDWGGGALHFTWALYYLAIPESVGGDRERSRELLALAVERGPSRLLNRWGRAKYFHVKMQNRDEFRADLEWVLAKDVHRMEGDYAWNAYFQKDAREMLENIDRFF
jgi:hypothetical protein